MARSLHISIEIAYQDTMNQPAVISPISTVLKIDQELDAVKHTLHEILADEVAGAENGTGHNSGNSFMLGWVKSFTIVMISVTLHKASDNSTNIHIEALNTQSDNKGMRIVQDGFYDFLYFFRRSLLPGVKITKSAGRNDFAGGWGWLFFAVLVLCTIGFLLGK